VKTGGCEAARRKRFLYATWTYPALTIPVLFDAPCCVRRDNASNAQRCLNGAVPSACAFCLPYAALLHCAISLPFACLIDIPASPSCRALWRSRYAKTTTSYTVAADAASAGSPSLGSALVVGRRRSFCGPDDGSSRVFSLSFCAGTFHPGHPLLGKRCWRSDAVPRPTRRALYRLAAFVLARRGSGIVERVCYCLDGVPVRRNNSVILCDGDGMGWIFISTRLRTLHCAGARAATDDAIAL